MPGRFRTASKPSRTVIDSESYAPGSMWLMTAFAVGWGLELAVLGSCGIGLTSSGWSKCGTGSGLLSDVRRPDLTSSSGEAGGTPRFSFSWFS